MLWINDKLKTNNFWRKLNTSHEPSSTLVEVSFHPRDFVPPLSTVTFSLSSAPRGLGRWLRWHWSRGLLLLVSKVSFSLTVGFFCGLNVCVPPPPHSYIETLSHPNVTVLGGGEGDVEVMRVEPLNGISALLRVQRACFSTLCLVRTGWEESHLQTRKWTLTGP